MLWARAISCIYLVETTQATGKFDMDELQDTASGYVSCGTAGAERGVSLADLKALSGTQPLLK